MQTQGEPIQFVSSNGQQLVLRRLGVRGLLRDDLATIELEQQYRNAEDVNIEATYTFPLPVGCVLLDLSVALNDRLLVARVAARVQAENEYEESLANGDTGIMLVELSKGLYQMNVGNLLPGDEARIRIRYAMPLKWEGGALRLALPTTIAPRYGDAAEAGVKPYQLPVTDTLVENAYDLSIRIEGELASQLINSPSHAITLSKSADATIATLSGGTALADRDFVLGLAAHNPLPSRLRLAAEGEATIAHAVFRIPAAPARQPVVLKVLIDCSGSMNGDSMLLARSCATHALGLLGRGDLFSTSAFGSTVVHDPQFDGVLMPAGRDSPVMHALRFVNGLQADLGGTEMEQALNSVYALRRVRRGSVAAGLSTDGSTVEGGDVLLITDGEIWGYKSLADAARRSGHRIFVIAIGCSPNEALGHDLAMATGGATVYVGPNEPIAPVVERQIARMRSPRITNVKLDLPGQPRWRTPEQIEGEVHSADTLHVFAMLDQATGEAARLTLKFADGSVQSITAEQGQPQGQEPGPASVGRPGDLCRIGVAQLIAERIRDEDEANEAEITALALQYGLHTMYTHYILTAERGESAATDLPELREVPQMLAAGWGGTSTLSRMGNQQQLLRAANSVSLSHSLSPLPKMASPMPDSWSRTLSAPLGSAYLMDADSVSYKISPRIQSKSVAGLAPAEFIRDFNAECNNGAKGINPARTALTIHRLRQMQVPEDILADLEQLRSEGCPEESLIVAFLRVIMDSASGYMFGSTSGSTFGSTFSASFERPARRRVIQLSVLLAPNPNLVVALRASLAAMTADAWNWVTPNFTATDSLCGAEQA